MVAPYSIKKNWSGMVLIDRTLMCGDWNIEIDFDADIDYSFEQIEIAMMRVVFLFNEQLDHGVWISEQNPLLSEIQKNLETKLLTIPDEPFDQLIAAVLAKKIQAISAGVLSVNQIKISSTVGFEIISSLTLEQCDELLLSVNAPSVSWYYSELPTCGECYGNTITQIQDWNNVALGWEAIPDATEKTPPRGNPGWKPTVIINKNDANN